MLSDDFAGRAVDKARFRCADGHEFETSPMQLKRGNWCPDCYNITEGLVRQFFECAFERPFPQATPGWLKDDGEHRRCRLDGYCEALNLAFEYHGAQHATHVDFFHKAGRSRTLEEQQARDAFVRERCAANGVTLIEVPHLGIYTQPEFVEHLVTTLTSQGIPVDQSAIDRFEAKPFRVSKLQQAQALAEARGGRCLSTKFISHDSKLAWVCAEGHTWEANLTQVRTVGQWCTTCAKAARDAARKAAAMTQLKAIAESKGGEVLSAEYVRNDEKLKFRCANAHTWEAVPATIKRGHWCPCCGETHLEDPAGLLRQLAAERGGVWLGDSYANRRQLQPFRCATGHHFEVSLQRLKDDGCWCPDCRTELAVAPDQLAAARLTDEQWEAIRPLVESPLQRKGGVGALKSRLRDIVEAVRFVLLTGCAWTVLPDTFPPYKTAWYFYKKWHSQGVLKTITTRSRSPLAQPNYTKI